MAILPESHRAALAFFGFDEIADWFETLAKAEKMPRRPVPEGAGYARLDVMSQEVVHSVLP